jgi:hypothetical protein
MRDQLVRLALQHLKTWMKVSSSYCASSFLL